MRMHTGEPSRVGFVVSKAVGNAVTRNKVKRRLRELSASSVRDQPHGMDVVVRALPPAAAADWDELGSDYRAAFTAAVRRAR
ncbi:ribonuclease P protein component [Kocuria rhizophila]|nr:ribonuclease P protein component [Kocuria rhizophila]